MSVSERHNDLTGEEHESENGESLEVTFHYADCFDRDEAGYMGVTLRRDRGGDIISGSATPFFRANNEMIMQRAISAAVDATENGSRRSRVPPERPPRSPLPILSWDRLVRLESNIEREREAAEIASPRELDNEPNQSTWPRNWDTHHDYFLWTCRGTVDVITEHLQAIFRFEPAIDETFVAARLCGVNAYRQLTFLQKYLPGEVHSLQRAEARGIIYEADISHPDIRMGSQNLELEQLDAGDPKYIAPVLPCWAPPNWGRADDAFAALYLGEDPIVFQREYGWACTEMPTIEFISIRMAQIPHLNLNWMELQAAKSRHDILVTTCQSDAPDYHFF
ncbi:hypothetical protein BDW67DRAFT_1225 [Aspergillus spinulosporus]